MDQHQAQISWKRAGQVFSDNQYSRAHEWKFDGGLSIPASSAPSSVPLPYSVAENIDPEEALVAALSSCHMLFFLAFAAKQGYIVDSYTDEATGYMEANERRRKSITRITLRPHVEFSGDTIPGADQIAALHALSHDHCYIANSIRAEVSIESV